MMSKKALALAAFLLSVVISAIFLPVAETLLALFDWVDANVLARRPGVHWPHWLPTNPERRVSRFGRTDGALSDRAAA